MRFICRRLLLTGLLGMLLVGAARADRTPADTLIGKKIANVAFTGASGKTAALDQLTGKKALVVVFLSFECPVSNSYSQPLAELAKAYGERGVAFIGVSGTDEDDAAQIARFVKEFNIPFPVFRDPRQAAADALKAEATPQVFVLDADRVLRYRGRIDDAYSARLKKNARVTSHDLRQALDDLLAGKAVSTPITEAVGCPIARATTPAKSAAVTYHRDVLPILQNHCQTCHRPGEVGPFALMNYRQAVNWAGDIKDYTQSRKMPPWKPAEGLAFHNERRLSDKDLATLAAWADNGTPEGNPSDAPPPRRFTDGWQLGKPDLVLTMPGDFQVGATGGDIFRSFVLPTDLPEDRHVVAVEVRPGNPRVVHHALLFLDTTGEARKLEQKEKERTKDPAEQDVGPGYSASMGIGIRPSGGLSGWAPGQVPRFLPEGTAFFLPKGADVVLQLHYHRDGKIEKDRTAIGLYFADKPVSKRFWGMVIPGRFLFIPAGDEHYKVEGSITVQQDCEVHSVMPHMHKLGKEIKVTMVPPAGPARTVIAIRDWDYNWQETYFFKEPLAVKAGTRFTIEAIYDNSAKNPNNPHRPPRAVFVGRETTNEMCFGFLGATSDQPGRIRFQVSPRETRNEEAK